MTTIAPADNALHLDDLIANIEHSGESRHELLLEHLRSARAYLLGSMREEFMLNLEFAQQAAHDEVADETFRCSVLERLANLLSEAKRQEEDRRQRMHHCPPPAGDMTEEGGPLSSLFKGSRTILGLFYPKHFILAAFRSFESSRQAKDALRQADFTEQQAIAVPGWQMVEFLENNHRQAGLFADLAVELSRVLDTEANLEDSEQRLARRGAGFVAVYAPDEEIANKVANLLKPFAPMMIVWYRPYYIRHLM